MRAMVLAAGLGTRLRPITYAVPKPMVPVLNRPVMEHSVRLLVRHGFSEAIANLHWFPETIEGHFGDGSEFGIQLSYSHEEQLLGTAGGVRNDLILLSSALRPLFRETIRVDSCNRDLALDTLSDGLRHRSADVKRHRHAGDCRRCGTSGEPHIGGRNL